MSALPLHLDTLKKYRRYLPLQKIYKTQVLADKAAGDTSTTDPVDCYLLSTEETIARVVDNPLSAMHIVVATILVRFC